jgi:hypothetical protein
LPAALGVLGPAFWSLWCLQGTSRHAQPPRQLLPPTNAATKEVWAGQNGAKKLYCAKLPSTLSSERADAGRAVMAVVSSLCRQLETWEISLPVDLRVEQDCLSQ